MRILKLGLTGGIGSGKSTIAGMFSDLGAIVLDADEVAFRALELGGKGYEKVVKTFGLEVINENKTVNRKKLAAVVFNDSHKREILNSIVHPIVWEEEKLLQESAEAGSLVITNAALIIESGGWKRFDKIVVVYCEDEVRVKRLLKRGMEHDDIHRRIAAQMTLSEKLKYADFVINNSGNKEASRSQVEEVYRKLMSLFGE